MAIDPFGLGTASGASSTSSTAMSQLSEDYQSFITLLTAQIQNQDPLEPMDSTTFVSQLAQLSQVEQAVASNANLEGIASQLTSLSAITGLSLIGKTVVAPTNQVGLSGGIAELGYRLGQEADSVTLTIKTADGTVLRSYGGLPVTPGELHELTWDGLDYEGLPLPDGQYVMVLEAVDGKGDAVASQTYAASEVMSMTYESGLATLHLANSATVLAGMIEEVR
ncbi:flagellar hook assembly protein FlgD [Salipiger sp. P9]|uniref:flagellar hook assembly protein FlgD n=1 Tax=Salipiger pentaromativorans TaxID=2943193 RepID=UPI00215806E8|nr:flagellar hook capping FlgD N-terminal domain-containing protein [Salipiger pentaromativorans]MCR8550580.1 flagellar hook assembly protein FlgD [Salipiger pentaromativorans]